MLKVFVAVLVLVTYNTKAEIIESDICKQRVTDLCSNEKIPREFPESEEDLHRTCAAGIEYLECGINYEKKCNNPNPIVQKIESSLLPTIKEICDEDSILHAAVADNIKCFSEFEKEDHHQECYREMYSSSLESLSQYADTLIEEGLIELTDDENQVTRTHECIHTYKLIACQAVRLEKKCGKMAMDTFVDIVFKFGPAIMHGCDETNNLLPAVIRLYKLEKEQNKKQEEEQEETNVISEIFKKRK